MSLSPADSPITLPETGDGARASRRRARRRRIVFPAVSVVLALAIPTLAWVGFRTLVRSDEGDLVGRRRPTVGDLTLVSGAVIPPTPTGLVVQRGPEAGIEGLTIMSMWPGGGGGVVFVPAGAVEGLGPGVPIGDVVQGVERLLDVRIETTFELDDAGWARVTGRAGPLLVDNPDPLLGFRTGSIDMEAGRVGEFLRARQPGESDLARLVRHQALWEGWLSRLRSDAEAAPAGDDGALARFVRGLSSGSVVYRTLPVKATRAPGGGEILAVDPVAVRLLVAQLMPGALAPEADRPRVRLLNATRRDVLLLAARRISRAGAEIVLVGPTDRVTDTEVAYHRPAAQSVASRLERELGVGDLLLRRQDVEAFEVTVVIGDDFTAGEAGD